MTLVLQKVSTLSNHSYTAMAYSYGYQIQSARAEAEAQYQLNLREAREAVDELVRHIHVSLILAIKQKLNNAFYCSAFTDLQV